MPFEALKFIHATGLLVDHQVRDAGPVSDQARQYIVDASLKSLERLVEVAVDQAADFVLLTGDTFCEQDRSLRARVAIIDALECLSEAGIQVFVIPGSEDPADAWHAISRLPDNVTIFDPVRDEPTAVMRDGQVIASLQGCPVWSNSPRPVRPADTQGMGQSRLGPLRIGVVPPLGEHDALPDEATVERWLERHRVDYLALSRPFHRLRVLRPEQVAFCPGGALPVTRRETGLRGAALISAEGRGAVNLSLVPTSPLRRETFNLRLDEGTSWDQLIGVMRAAIEKLNGLSRTQVLLANWHFEGCGEVLESLRDAESQAELFELLGADGAAAPHTLIEHRLFVQNPENENSPGRDAQDVSGHDDEADKSIAGSFRRRLHRSEGIAGDVVSRLRQAGGDSPSPWTRRIETLATRVDAAAVSHSVRQQADAWFAGVVATASAVAKSAATHAARVVAETPPEVEDEDTLQDETRQSVDATLNSIDAALGALQEVEQDIEDELDAADDGYEYEDESELDDVEAGSDDDVSASADEDDFADDADGYADDVDDYGDDDDDELDDEDDEDLEY